MPCTTSKRSCLFRTTTNHQYRAQRLNLFRTATNRQYRAQRLNVPAYLEQQRTVNTVHNISTFMSIQYCNEPSIPCTMSQPSCLFRTTTNCQYRAQRLNVHVYSVLQRTINTVHNISTFMSISTATNHQYRAQRLNMHVYSVLQRTVNTVHNVSTIMSIQNNNEPSIPYTTSQRSCLFRTTTNRQYCAQCLNVHAYSEREWFNYMYISILSTT